MKETRNPNDEVRKTESELSPASRDPVAERSKRRIERWKSKYNVERVAAVLSDKRESMSERYRAQALMLCHVDKSVAEVTDAAGVPSMMRIWYKSFGREVCRIWRTIPSSCQELEYDVIRYKWTARGLDPILLPKVKVAVIELLEAGNFPRKHEPLT